MTPPSDSFVGLVDFLRPCCDPWTIFGGAALCLHGILAGPPKDIDVLLSLGDAERIAARHGLANEAAGGAERFRSQTLLHPSMGTVPVELMAGFDVLTGDGWVPVRIEHHVTKTIGGVALPVATLPELARLFRLFRRPKDLERLRRIAPSEG